MTQPALHHLTAAISARRCAGRALTLATVCRFLFAPVIATAKNEPPAADAEPPAEIALGPALSLADALRAVEKRNVTLTAARAEIDKANAQLSSAWAHLVPTLAGQFSYTHNDHADTFSQFTARRQDILSGGVTLSVPLVAPQAWASVDAARRGIDVAKLGVDNVRDRLLLATAQAYWVAVVNRDLVDIRRNQVSATREHRELARARLKAGAGLRLDVVRADTELQEALQDLLTAHVAFDNARDALGALIGSDDLPLPSDPPTLAPPADTDPRTLDDAAGKRADVRAAQANVALADRLVAVARMQFFPALGVGAQYGYQFTDPPDLGSTDRSRWSVLVTLAIPLYDHARYAELDARRASLRQATARAEDATRTAKLEARRARRDYLSALAATKIAEDQVALAHEGLTLAESAYKNGAATSIELSDAQRAAQNAELGVSAARLRSQMALLSLLYTTGTDLSTLADNATAR